MSPSTSIDKAIIDLKVCNTLAHITYYVDLGDSADAKACIDIVLRVLDEFVRALTKHAPNAQRSLIRRIEQAYNDGRRDRLIVNTTREGENGVTESSERPVQSDDSAQSAVAVAINAVASLSTQPSGADGEQHDSDEGGPSQQQGSSDEPMDGNLCILLSSQHLNISLQPTIPKIIQRRTRRMKARRMSRRYLNIWSMGFASKCLFLSNQSLQEAEEQMRNALMMHANDVLLTWQELACVNNHQQTTLQGGRLDAQRCRPTSKHGRAQRR